MEEGDTMAMGRMERGDHEQGQWDHEQGQEENNQLQGDRDQLQGDHDRRLVVILDDDPTGTQTVSDVQVILTPDREAYRAFIRRGVRAVYVLTNTRAMPEDEARRLVGTIRSEMEEEAAEAGVRVTFVLRGDSTLRGHVFAEIDELAGANSVALFVPAFPEGGRTTVGGVHYLQQEGVKVPVCRTEFARDAVFGYRSERLADWSMEIRHGRPAVTIPLERLRADGAIAVARVLLDAPHGFVVIPDAETSEDLERVAAGLQLAETARRHVVVRSASSFAAIRAGLRGRDAVLPARAEQLLIVCGSHTAASTKQLNRLAEAWSLAPVVLPTAGIVGSDRETALAAAEAALRDQLGNRGVAVLATERIRQEGDQSLETGKLVMSALTDVVRRVAREADAIVSKGGITSAQIATDGLGARTAFVLGQLEAGVSLWELDVPGRGAFPYAVIPGNVGDEGTLLRIVERFRRRT
ncbi:four-carbon acid sugar kinase family protein [Paenibacillus koleovorans]|uniref:four-carbon acid sugar kinase family protein n=1 Tax=Paenibacillus koleovorans TaxID=121608 RepID=UPI000FD896BB|nr:four-carbon acid sugar kinase family protein [Paenibacillus koleovorans]